MRRYDMLLGRLHVHARLRARRHAANSRNRLEDSRRSSGYAAAGKGASSGRRRHDGGSWSRRGCCTDRSGTRQARQLRSWRQQHMLGFPQWKPLGGAAVVKGHQHRVDGADAGSVWLHLQDCAVAPGQAVEDANAAAAARDLLLEAWAHHG